MLKEFQDFIKKGNVLQMAVGLIMALYFGAITKSFVDDILMPPLGLLIGGVDFSSLKLVLQEGVAAVMDGDVVVTEAVKEVSINYGTFINTIITFLIVAFAVFMLVKAYNKMEKKKEEAPAPAAPPAPSKEEILLAEIRDELRKRS
ncbi:large-conductance mechanosensitive channel protein MscL [Acidiluteibacter ferrifornacis]|uniref:Large-conductance mechanosensitive channel n=2 Tax=Acidiluteibacter ferrifornacis TaxID=2692424 RepID=A0A6N9NJ92_9FLAO|nr:large-conductance mechanosensitive channel protein MscL [Acidiluteibacter ferrifornacis]NBG65993.1 large-conductance mechanosensitive channel protein MscL [Acidiluteibacter ferrifornacis]